jgi:hypothetical protein
VRVLADQVAGVSPPAFKAVAGQGEGKRPVAAAVEAQLAIAAAICRFADVIAESKATPLG